MPPPKKAKLSSVTRFVVVPLLLLAVGIRLGMSLERARHPPREAPPPAAAPLSAVPVAVEAPREPEAAPAVAVFASFEGNVYPSLLLSLSAAYPEYARCLTLELRNLPASGAVQLRLDSGLFLRPLLMRVGATGATAILHPDLPWNFELLRRVSQSQPQTFIATLLVDGRQEAEASVVCTVHSVNEAVSRISTGPGAQWQDTSVCFASFVNEDHPWISTLLQEAVASGGVKTFSGYQAGPQGVLSQVQAVWDALAARGLTYVNVATDSAASPLVSTQYVRFLDQSVHDQGANCVDASVLFCSILRRIGLRPVLIFRPGHCFAGFYDGPDSGRIVAFETTLLGQAGFPAAAAEGAKELQSTLPFLGTAQYSLVDIALCRQQGISPIAFQQAESD